MDWGFFKSTYFFMWVGFWLSVWLFHRFAVNRAAKDTKQGLNDKSKEIKE